jgi:hypothetical protein
MERQWFHREKLRRYPPPPVDNTLEVPYKNDLGRDLALTCAAQALPGNHEAVEDCLRRQGAYGRFEPRREGHGAREKWCAFVDRATKEAVCNWDEENCIRLGEGSSRQGAVLSCNDVKLRRRGTWLVTRRAPIAA